MNDDDYTSSSSHNDQPHPRDSHSTASVASNNETNGGDQLQQQQHQHQRRRFSITIEDNSSSVGLGAPYMDRAVPEVPLPPFIPLPRDVAFVDIGGDDAAELEKRKRRAVFLEQAASSSSATFGTIDPQYIAQQANEAEDAYAADAAANGTPIPPAPAWPYLLSPAAREFILERPEPQHRSFRHRLPNADRIREHFRAGGRLALDDALWIIQSAQMILLEETNVLELKSPITVCGDTHGQFFDVLTLLDLGGSPTSHTNPTQYLFLGDYVDRGCFSTEVALLLLSYKLLRPQQMWLLRGNHECRHLTSYFNFKIECCKKYGEQVYDAFMNCFDALPLAARVDNRFLCVHGGLGPDIRSVEDISLIQRVMEPPPRGPMCDLLWSDPMEPDEEAAAPGARFLYNDIRSCSYSFSYKATLEFLKANNLLALIRAHESQFEGYRMFQKVPETGMPSVICIFSAPNYCEYNNKAAIIQLEDHSIRVKQFAAVEHPYVLQNFLNAFTWSVPFLVDKCQHVVTEVANMSPIDPIAYAAEKQKQLERSAAATAIAAAAAAAAVSSSSPSTAAAGGEESASASAAVPAPAAAATRPLLHALQAAGGAKAMAREVLQAHQQNLRSRTNSLSGGPVVEPASVEKFLLSLAMRARSFFLLPRFLRRRGKYVLVKLKAVIWFRLQLERLRLKEQQRQHE